MNVNIVKFMPPDMRAKIVQDVIAGMGIRPLSNAIGVNSKTVYKYKFGFSCPTDETMVKILMVTREKYPNLFEKYVSELRDNFSTALKISPTLETLPVKNPKVTPPKPKPVKKLQHHEAQKVKVETTEPVEVSKFVVYEKLGLSNPSDRIMLAKILAAMQGAQTFSPSAIAEKSNAPQDIVEKYADMLIKVGYAEKIARGMYRLAAKIQM